VATAEALRIDSANHSSPGVELNQATDSVSRNFVLLSRQGPRTASNLDARLAPRPLPDARPNLVLFGALRDPRLHLGKAIPLNVLVENSTVIVCWSEINEFGTGETLSSAIDDFAGGLRDLYHSLFAPDIALGPDLKKVKETLGQFIQPQQ
jgi:hypothetical protein